MSELRRIIDGLAAVRAAREREEEAAEVRATAEIRLAELVEVNRRDKDTGFEAEHEAERRIVAAALSGDLAPVTNALAEPIA